MASLQINGKRRIIPWGINNKRLFYYMHQTYACMRPWQIPLIHAGARIRQNAASKRLGCCVPRVLLLDPTSACNLKCVGCYAAGYSRNDALTFEELDSIVAQAERMGVHLFLFTGGEPTLRRDDLLRLAKKHPLSLFSAFTNGTLFDEGFADAVARVKNLTFAFSVEGFEAETDFRRGAGVYQKVMHAMDLLRERDVAFAYSVCCTARNIELVSSEAFVAEMERMGCWGGWHFTYMPLGVDAGLDLVLSPVQRASLSRKTRALREKGHLLFDFWGDSFLVGGCIAAGRQYLHINARGDVEPCVFCHYADANIRDMSLEDALKSPFLRAFRGGQPFRDNPFLPCPVRDNPARIKELVEHSGARSTEYGAPEPVNDLYEKLAPAARAWEESAAALCGELRADERGCNAYNMEDYRRHPW